jgi:hypothetical protein
MAGFQQNERLAPGVPATTNVLGRKSRRQKEPKPAK